MAKKSTPTEKAARMLDLVPFISTHQGISTYELASEFAISIPELLSDLNALWMCGDSRFDLIDLQFESGYVSIRNAQTLNRVRNLSQQEIVSILLGLDLISKELPEDRRDLRADIEALRKKLGKGAERLVDATPASSSAILTSLKAALTNRNKVKISYISSVSETLTSRIVNPLDLYTDRNRDFFLAFCELAQAERTFRVDRIGSVELLNIQAINREQNSQDFEMAKAKISISRDLRHSRESLGHFLSGEGAEVEVSAYSLSWLARTVISSGGAMKVLQPTEVRSEVAALAAKTLGLYR